MLFSEGNSTSNWVNLSWIIFVLFCAASVIPFSMGKPREKRRRQFTQKGLSCYLSYGLSCRSPALPSKWRPNIGLKSVYHRSRKIGIQVWIHQNRSNKKHQHRMKLFNASNILMSSLTSNHSNSSVSFGILGSPAQVPKAIGPEGPKIDDQQTHPPNCWGNSQTMKKEIRTSDSLPLLHPQKLTWNLKKAQTGEGKTSTNHQFLRFHVSFPGCNLKKKL